MMPGQETPVICQEYEKCEIPKVFLEKEKEEWRRLDNMVLIKSNLKERVKYFYPTSLADIYVTLKNGMCECDFELKMTQRKINRDEFDDTFYIIFGDNEFDITGASKTKITLKNRTNWNHINIGILRKSLFSSL
jgi:hypothetical protein